MSNINNLKAIKEDRVALVQEMDNILEAAKKEDRNLSKDEQVKWDGLYSKEAELRKAANTLKTQDDLNKSLAAESTPVKDDVSVDQKEARSAAFTKYIKKGMQGLNSEERSLVEKRGTDTQITTTDSLGGYIVPKGFSDVLNQKLMGGYSSVMAAGRNHGSMIETASGNPLYYPNTSDADTGAMVTEGAAGTVSDITFGNTILNSYTFTSNIVKISRELLTDEGFDVNSYLNEILARRLGRAMNEKLTTGTGSSQPKGIVTAATDSTIDFSADLPTLGEMQDLYHAVDIAYRNENSCWFMSDHTWKLVKQMVVNSNLIADANILSGIRPSFDESGNAGVVFGRPVYINDNMQNNTSTGFKSMVFGDISQFKIRLVGQPQLLRLDERYADSLSVGFILFHRMDSNLVTAGNALNYATRA
jgi:HK97 family phage major capsid protein